MEKIIDAKNTLTQHIIVGAFALGLTFFFNLFLGTHPSTAFGRTSFLLLFLTLVISPLMKLIKKKESSSLLKSPWSWRGELGIWFAVTGFIHFFIVMNSRLSWNFARALGQGGFGLANIAGLIALALGIALALTSSGRVINYIGRKNWKYLQSFSYVIFYLISIHLIYFQFLSERSDPNWFGYTAVAMIVLLVALQLAALGKEISKHRES